MRYFIVFSTALCLCIATSGCSDDDKNNDKFLGCPINGSISVTGAVSGTLTSNDLCNAEGEGEVIVDVYRLNISANSVTHIFSQSDDFDTFLVLFDEAENLIGEDDDGWLNLNSRISLQVPTTLASPALRAMRLEPTAWLCALTRKGVLEDDTPSQISITLSAGTYYNLSYQQESS